MKIQIIIASTRNGRQGGKVGQWVYQEVAKKAAVNKDFEVELLDLLEWNLPTYQEPHGEIANKWKAKIAEADGYIIVTPEYNHGYPSSLKTALDYPYDEWNKKAVGFVGYSDGMSAGIRSVEQLRQVAIQLQLAPIRQAMYFPNVVTAFEGDSPVDPGMQKRLETFVNELLWWTGALKVAREKTN